MVNSLYHSAGFQYQIVMQRAWASIGARVFNGLPSVRYSPFERLSFLAYGLLFAALLTEALAIILTDFVYNGGDFVAAFYLMIWIAVTGLISRRYGFFRIADGLEATSLTFIGGGLTAVGNAMLARVSLPFADPWLVKADALFGFNWLRLFEYYQANSWLLSVSTFAYRSMFIQIYVLLFALTFTRMKGRIWGFVTAWSVAGLLTTLIFPFFPAVGPFVYFGITPADLPSLKVTFPWDTGPTIESIRSGIINDLAAAPGGLVSFPSFHTASAILFAWAAWPLRRLRYPFLVLNILMILSTPVRGAHYLVDLIGGGIVAGVSIAIASAFIRRASENRRGGSITTTA